VTLAWPSFDRSRTRAGVVDFLYPLLASWSVAAYIHGVQYLYIMEVVDAPAVYFLALPVVVLELWLGHGWPPGLPFRRSGETPAQPTTGNRVLGIKGWLGLFFNLVFWLSFFAVWVGVFGWFARGQAKWLKWFAPEFYLQFYLVFIAQGWLTWVLFAAWLAVYVVVTVRRQRFRIMTTMVLPMAIGLGMFHHLYEYGGIGGFFESRVAAQTGVTRIINLRAQDPTIPAHPRGVCHDAKQNALLVMFGCTYCNDLVFYPTVVRYDLATGRTHAFKSSNIRQTQCEDPDDTILVAPWYREHVYQLSRTDLTTVAIFPTRVSSLSYWEPMSILRDGHMLYIGNDVEQAVVAFDMKTFSVTKVLNLHQLGLVQYGGPAWNLVQSQKTRRIYFTSGPGANLLEVEPETLQIVKHRAFHDVSGTGLEIDDERNVIYYQNGGLTDELYEIDVESFAVKRTFHGEGHARHILLDRARNRIYVLGYFSGSVFALDRDTGRRVWTRKVGGLPHGMALDKDTLWVNSRPGVVQLDLAAIEQSP
jgi:outer membrane protein assembly factor BamB